MRTWKNLLLLLALCVLLAFTLSFGAFAESGGLREPEAALAGTRFRVERLREPSVQAAAYTVYDGAEALLTVEYRELAPEAELQSEAGAQNGYYTARFDLDETHEVFLTGLTARNLISVQNALVEARLDDRYLSLTDLDFIDAEKSYYSDSHQCWAATASNLLRYTGWAGVAGFHSEDELFKLYRSQFTDTGGRAYYGWQWFFNGINLPQELGWDDWSLNYRDSYGSFTGYLPEYAMETVVEYWSVSENWRQLDAVLERLRQGWGVGMGIGWYSGEGTRDSGHGVSLWGYVLDRSTADRLCYSAFLISDSDSENIFSEFPQSLPNRMRLLMTEPFDGYGMETLALDYYEGLTGILEDFDLLRPRSAAPESEAGGTCNKFTSPDAVISGVSLPTSRFAASLRLAAERETPVFVRLQNNSAVALDAPLRCRVRLLREDGSEAAAAEELYADGLSGLADGEEETLLRLTLPGASAGDYTLSVSVEPVDAPEEAYTVNNRVELPVTLLPAAEGPDFTVSVTPPARFSKVSDNYADLSYTGLEEVPGTEYRLYAARMEDGVWGAYELKERTRSVAELPDQLPISPEGEQLRVLLVAQPADAGQACRWAESEPAAYRYHALEIVVPEQNTGTYSELSAGSKHLAEGEQFAFQVKNVSTATDTLRCTVSLWFVRQADGAESYDILESRYLAQEGTTGLYQLNSWRDPRLEGLYTVYAVAKASDCEVWEPLGEVNFSLPQGDVRFLSVDSTVDGPNAKLQCTLLRTGSGQVQVEYLAENWESVKTSQMGYQKVSGAWNYTCTLQLVPGRSYSWRVVCGDRHTDWQTVSIPLESFPVVPEGGELEVTATEGGFACFSFLPQRTGYYLLSFNMARSGTLYRLNGENWSYQSYDDLTSNDQFSQYYYMNAREREFFYMTYATTLTPRIEAATGPADFSLGEVTLLHSNLYQIYLGAELETPLGSSYEFGLDYGLDPEDYQTESRKLTRYSSTTDSLSVAITAKQGEVWYARSWLRDTESGELTQTEWRSFTAKPEADVILRLDEPVDFTAYHRSGLGNYPGSSYDGCVYYSFTAPKDGVYRVVLADKEIWSIYGVGLPLMMPDPEQEQTFGLFSRGWLYYEDGGFNTLELQAGETCYFRTAPCMRSGIYTLMVTGLTLDCRYETEGDELYLRVSGNLPETFAPAVLSLPGRYDSKAEPRRIELTEPGDFSYRFDLGGCDVPLESISVRVEHAGLPPVIQTLSGDDIQSGAGSQIWLELCEPAVLEAGAGAQIYLFEGPDAYYRVTAYGAGARLFVEDVEKSLWEEYGPGETCTYRSRYMVPLLWGPSYEMSVTRRFVLIPGPKGAEIVIEPNSTVELAARTGAAAVSVGLAELSVEADFPYGSSVWLGVDCGRDRTHTDLVLLELDNWKAAGCEQTLRLPVQPDTEYCYRAVLRTADGELRYGEWRSFRSDPGEAERLRPGELSGPTTEGCFCFTAPRDGVYTLSFSGAAGSALALNPAEGIWRSYTFDSDTRTASFELRAGDTLQLRTEGLGRLMLSPGYAAVSRVEGKLLLNFVPEGPGHFLAAFYRADGQLISVTGFPVSRADADVLELPAVEGASYLQLFRLDKDTNAPLSERAGAILPD